MTTRKRTRKKTRQNVVYGRIYIQSTFNNTLITITDRSGSVLYGIVLEQKNLKGQKNLQLSLPNKHQRN